MKTLGTLIAIVFVVIVLQALTNLVIQFFQLDLNADETIFLFGGIGFLLYFAMLKKAGIKKGK